MKKLLVLMLVLGIASMASAGLANLTVNGVLLADLTIPGEITIEPSDWIELDMELPVGFGLGDFQISLSNAQAHLDDTGVAFSTQYVSMYIPTYGNVYAPWGLAWMGDVAGLQDDAQHFSLGGGNLPPTLTGFDEMVMSGLMLHCDELTEVIVTLEEYMGAGVFELRDSLIIHQIPEPMTMAFLGLGGLFLRRRK